MNSDNSMNTYVVMETPAVEQDLRNSFDPNFRTPATTTETGKKRRHCNFILFT